MISYLFMNKMGFKTEPNLAELVKELEKLTPDWQKLKYDALRKGYNTGHGARLNKEVYRNELIRYIEYYGGQK